MQQFTFSKSVVVYSPPPQDHDLIISFSTLFDFPPPYSSDFCHSTPFPCTGMEYHHKNHYPPPHRIMTLFISYFFSFPTSSYFLLHVISPHRFDLILVIVLHPRARSYQICDISWYLIFPHQGDGGGKWLYLMYIYTYIFIYIYIYSPILWPFPSSSFFSFPPTSLIRFSALNHYLLLLIFYFFSFSTSSRFLLLLIFYFFSFSTSSHFLLLLIFYFISFPPTVWIWFWSLYSILVHVHIKYVTSHFPHEGGPTVQGGVKSWDALSLRVIFRKRAL